MESEQSIVVLSIGHDTTLLSTRHLLLQSAGYIVESASSIERAIKSLRDGDFDLVIMCHSLSEEERKGLTHHIREDGSSIPIVFVASSSAPNTDRFASASTGTDPVQFLCSVKAVLQA